MAPRYAEYVSPRLSMPGGRYLISSLKPLLTKSRAAKYADHGELNVSIACFIKQYH
jgi:hypothetical protein